MPQTPLLDADRTVRPDAPRLGAFAPAPWGQQLDRRCLLGCHHPEDMPTHPARLDSPDAALVARAATGDERALGELYDRYGAMAFSLACAIVGERADAEEVVADTFAQVWRSAAGFDPARGSVAAWVATIARSRALDLVRSRRRRARVLEEAAVVTDEGEALVLAPSLEPADRNAEMTETSVLVRRSLADLPAPQRRVIELAYFGGLSQSEIATQLSEPLGTVKTRMRAGMEKLRQALRPVLEVGA
jgi:RNA polymerase sigma-70 factor, ECF subfamily